MSSVGHPEGQYGSGKDPRRERHQTEEPVNELLEDERSDRCCGNKSPDCSYDETSTLKTESLCAAEKRKSYSLFVSIRFGQQLMDWRFNPQVTKSMGGVVKSMDAALKSMNLEKVGCHLCMKLICLKSF